VKRAGTVLGGECASHSEKRAAGKQTLQSAKQRRRRAAHSEERRALLRSSLSESGDDEQDREHFSQASGWFPLICILVSATSSSCALQVSWLTSLTHALTHALTHVTVDELRSFATATYQEQVAATADSAVNQDDVGCGCARLLCVCFSLVVQCMLTVLLPPLPRTDRAAAGTPERSGRAAVGVRHPRGDRQERAPCIVGERSCGASQLCEHGCGNTHGQQRANHGKRARNHLPVSVGKGELLCCSVVLLLRRPMGRRKCALGYALWIAVT
jgi:hypothetical protein